MLAASIPENEEQRLAVLCSLNILDSEKSEYFERLVRLVGSAFNVPMVAVSFVDENRQWFKSSIGLPVCETTRDVSFCAHAVASGEALVVEDTLLDKRFADNPLVTGAPYLKFYAGVPLKPYGDAILGTLCLLSNESRQLTERELGLLHQFAEQVETLIRYYVDQAQLHVLRQKEKDQLEFLRSIINASSNPILVKRPEEGYILANMATLDALKVTSTDEAATAMIHLIDEQQRSQAEEIDERVMRTGHSESRRVCFTDGRYYDVRKSQLMGAEQQVLGVVTVAHDVTELIEYNEKLLQQQNLLELMHDAEKRANNAKSDFLSAMNHELKTPLHAIGGFSQLLLKSKTETLSDKQRRQVTQIYESSDYLLSLINDVLDLSTIEAGMMSVSMSDVMLLPLVQDVIETVRGMPSAKTIKIKYNPKNDPDQSVYADEKRLRQVFYNLLSNAVKYNRPGGEVEIKWRALDAGKVRIEIKDTGVGIAKKDDALLFQPFHRLGYENDDGTDGTGIGLPLTKKIVECLQGRIGFTSTVNKGSTFWFELKEQG